MKGRIISSVWGVMVLTSSCADRERGARGDAVSLDSGSIGNASPDVVTDRKARSIQPSAQMANVISYVIRDMACSKDEQQLSMLWFGAVTPPSGALEELWSDFLSCTTKASTCAEAAACHPYESLASPSGDDPCEEEVPRCGPGQPSTTRLQCAFGLPVSLSCADVSPGNPLCVEVDGVAECVAAPGCQEVACSPKGISICVETDDQGDYTRYGPCPGGSACSGSGPSIRCGSQCAVRSERCEGSTVVSCGELGGSFSCSSDDGGSCERVEDPDADLFQRRMDCRSLSPELVCQVSDFAVCTLPRRVCNPEDAYCDGDTLRACVGGGWMDIPCGSFGGATCKVLGGAGSFLSLPVTCSTQ
ncbi:MAG: hypothetical protein IV100_11475 [Myxococcales bacterium]|nr:hypothetical protein [Myxococcales bacterium]